jgi:hypothetical protein
MTENEFIFYCLIVAIVIIIAIVMHEYPMAAAINGTHAMVVGTP